MSDPSPDWLALEISIFRRPAEIAEIGPVRLDEGSLVTTLDGRLLTRSNLFDVGFEDVHAALVRDARTDVEPDGYLVRTGETAGGLWRLQGHIFELGERVWRLDLSGRCPSPVLDEVLRALRWPAIPVVFQLTRHGITIAEADFRRWASSVALKMV